MGVGSGEVVVGTAVGADVGAGSDGAIVGAGGSVGLAVADGGCLPLQAGISESVRTMINSARKRLLFTMGIPQRNLIAPADCIIFKPLRQWLGPAL
jgi:hypothetical protein